MTLALDADADRARELVDKQAVSVFGERLPPHGPGWKSVDANGNQVDRIGTTSVQAVVVDPDTRQRRYDLANIASPYLAEMRDPVRSRGTEADRLEAEAIAVKYELDRTVEDEPTRIARTR